MRLFRRRHLYLISAFVGLILVGTIFLKMPFVTHQDGIGWDDALFTSTAAVCVTNMCNLSTEGFNIPGQLVVLALIQIGGLGMMVIAATIVIILGQGVSEDSHMALGSSRHLSPRELENLIRTIVIYTLSIEGIGVVLLTAIFKLDQGMDIRNAAYNGLFHAVSAFCNAGFTPLPGNLMGVNSLLKVVISFLIIAGGLGFYVIFDLAGWFRKRSNLQINSKIVLIASVVLIVGGTLMIRLLESPISWLDAYFMAVSARSAGFYTVMPLHMHASTLIVLACLMLVGCSPNSTGGGIRTTGIAMIFLAVYNAFKGNTKLLLFKRQIPMRFALRAFAVTLAFLLISALTALTVSTIYGQSLKDIGFETISAITNCGLPLDYNESEHLPVRIMMSICMFLGRMGPLTIFLFFLHERHNSHLSYPQERIILG